MLRVDQLGAEADDRDLTRARRALRLEFIVVMLIAFEIIVTFYQIYAGQRGH